MITTTTPTSRETLILWPEQITADSPVGGKARSLASLVEARLPVPGWFVVLPGACDRSLERLVHRPLDEAGGVEEMLSVIEALEPGHELAERIDEAYEQLCPDGEAVAVRSSAADEDGAEHSFAGQLDSFLFVQRERLIDRIVDVWRSGFSDRILAYRSRAGLPALPPAPAVIVQRVVDGDVSGVAFSCDPVSGRRRVAVVAGVWGLGETLVSGEVDSDTWHVSRDGEVVQREIARKTIAARRDPGRPGGILRVPVPAPQSEAATLTDGCVVDVATLARKAEKHFGIPQDIEWTLSGDELFLLQSRPITTLADRADPDDTPRVWDNTNIIESYGGVTSPFTFSFIRRCYEQVYRVFCRLMGVSEEVVDENSEAFACILGLVNGRVYYNLVNGYRILTLLPAYKLNRRFTDEMLGIRGSLPKDVEGRLESEAAGARGSRVLLLLRTLWAGLRNFIGLDRRVEDFYARLHRVLPVDLPDISGSSPDELAELYRSLESELLRKWDAPTINDFFAAIFHGSLRRLTGRWLPAASSGLHNDLLCGDRELVSLQIAELVQQMAARVARSPRLIVTLREAEKPTVERAVRDDPELDRLYRSYVRRFGDRCLDELKLESCTLRDDPTPLFRAVAEYAQHLVDGGGRTSNIEQRILEHAEEELRRALAWHPIRRWVYRWVLSQARRRVRCRENLRFERTRAYGMVRRIVVEMGRRFETLGLIDDRRDIFYLTVEEMLAIVEGTAVSTDLRSLAALRKAEFDRHRQAPPTRKRFQTRGVPYVGGQFVPTEEGRPILRGESLQGIGCCPGLVRARVTFVEDPRGAVLEPDTIIVARRTDPGWVMIFPAASGLLVERGSMLSHSAIVAREMGLPTIVAIPGLLEALADGDLVEMDGSAGTVVRLEEGES